MATPDRTEELVRAMLERRADAPIPTWLADRTMHAVAASRQERPGLLHRLALPNGTPARVALVAAVALLLVALVGSALAVGGLLDEILDPGPGLPAVVVDPGDGSPSAGSHWRRMEWRRQNRLRPPPWRLRRHARSGTRWPPTLSRS